MNILHTVWVYFFMMHLVQQTMVGYESPGYNYPDNFVYTLYTNSQLKNILSTSIVMYYHYYSVHIIYYPTR